jgi:hypothetical protein
MRGFQEIRGHSTRLVYDRERAKFVIKLDPHRFMVGKPDITVEAQHNNGNGSKPARKQQC